MDRLNIKTTVTDLNWIESSGGPLVLAPLEDAQKWKGSLGAHYSEAFKSENEIETLSIDGSSFILLGEEAYPTTFFHSDDGGCLLRWIHGDDEDGMIESIRTSTYQLNRQKASVLLKTGPSGTLLLFDSASDMGAFNDQLLEIRLKPHGNYGMNWEYVDLSSRYRVMACSLFTYPLKAGIS